MSLQLTFAPDHRSAQGHFPGNPVIPGAVLLSETVQALCAALSIELEEWQIQNAKFLAPVRPGDCLTLAWTQPSETRPIKWKAPRSRTRSIASTMT